MPALPAILHRSQPMDCLERSGKLTLIMIHPILLRLSVAIYWSVRHLFYMYHMMKMTECGNFYAEKHTKQMKQSWYL